MEEPVNAVGLTDEKSKATIMDGRFIFREHADGTIDKTKVTCALCKKEFAYHRSTASLLYHIRAKHPLSAPVLPKASGDSESPNKTPKIKSKETLSDSLTTALARWIALNCRPIETVEDEGLTEVLQTASRNPLYRPPGRTTMANMISKMYEDEKKNKLDMLAGGSPGGVAVTVDHWTCDNHSFLGLTGHVIDGEWNLNNFALGVMGAETSSFGDRCADLLVQVIGEWGIENKITTIGTEGAASIVGRIRALPYEHVACSAHALQRTIRVSLENSGYGGMLTKCREVAEHFRQSPVRAMELHQLQELLGEERENLLKDVPTNWNSTLAMVSSLLRNRKAIHATLGQQNNHTLILLSKAEWEELEKLEQLLEPCRHVTELLGGDTFVPCSVTLPAFRHLDRVMDITDDDSPCVVEFKSAFQKALVARRAEADDTWFEVAAALDPRFKDLKCIPKEKRELVWTILESILQAPEPKKAGSAQFVGEDDEPAQKRKRMKNVLLLGFDSDSEEEEIECGELKRYRAEPCIEIDDCPLEWWRAHAGAYVKLSDLARKYLASPATSVPCERLFSLTVDMVQKRRAALLLEHVNKLVCLSDWLKKK